jgi:hypothetical protein
VRESLNYASRSDDRQAAEEDVADDLSRCFRDQRQPDMGALAQGIHESCFGRLTEGVAVDVSDGLVVSGGFGPNVSIHGFRSSAMAHACCVP